jgi:hypothetical protein
MVAVVHTMSSGAQAFWFFVAVAAFLIAAALYAICQPKPLRWAPVIACVGLAAFVFVFFWNAVVA